MIAVTRTPTIAAVPALEAALSCSLLASTHTSSRGVLSFAKQLYYSFWQVDRRDYDCRRRWPPRQSSSPRYAVLVAPIFWMQLDIAPAAFFCVGEEDNMFLSLVAFVSCRSHRSRRKAKRDDVSYLPHRLAAISQREGRFSTSSTWGDQQLGLD